MNSQQYEQSVFISYAWGGESEEIVNQIDQALQQRGLKIIRDKRDLGYKGSISAFMERIGQGNCVIVIISDKYLRSPNCMFELVEIAEGKQFHDRVFPIVLSDTNIYDPVRRLEYVKHWEMKRGELAQAMKKVDPANLQGIREDMDLYDLIRDKISGLTSILKDMNTLTPDMHRDSDFSEIYAGIERRIAEALGVLKPETGESPYMGLHYFDTSDAELFYGREVLTDELLARVQKESSLAIVGASGSGKSSVARAGLIPVWKAATTGSVHVITPTARPLESLAASLTREAESVTATSTLMDDLIKDARSLRLYVRKMLGGSGEVNLLLVVDQFEETFTLCKDPAERKAFIENLLSLADEDMNGNSAAACVVITLRADFYHHCAEYEGLRLMLEKHQVYIGTMTTDELRKAITAPAEKNGWDFQPGLVDLILGDVGTEPGALPLLSHALLETWKRRRGRTLTLQGYADAGGVKKAITQTADSVYDKLSPKEQTIARNIFLRLTELGEGVQDTRRRVKLEELAQTREQEVVAKVLKTLTDARLVTTEQNSAEVAHEALIREWGTLRNWLEEDRSFLLWQQRLQDAMHQWETSNRNEDEVLRGALLREAEMWLQKRGADLNPAEQGFILFCLALREHTSHSLDRAHEYYLKALEFDATLAEVHYYLHLLLLEKGSLNDALVEYQQAVSMKPELDIVPPGYVVTKILSASGPFITYQATDAQKNAIVFKVLKRAYDNKEILEVLRQAIDRSKKLDHPNIVKISAFDERRNRHYIVREFVTGRSLRELIDEKGPFSLKMSSDIMVQVCSTLSTIHSQGIVYGNIKPTNIYRTDSQIRLTDFGLAPITRSEDYLPPEPWQGEETPETDVYAAGAVFYEMLTRRRASNGISRSGLDSALELVIEGACSPTAEERYLNIDVFVNELSQAIPRQFTAKNVRWTGRLAAFTAQVIRETTQRNWPWLLVAAVGLGLLAPLLGEANVLRYAVRTASVLFTLILVSTTLVDWLSAILARQVRSAPIAAYGGAMGALLALASGLIWLRSLDFRMPNSPIPCNNADYLQPLGLGQVANSTYMLEVLPVFLIGGLITTLFVFAAISATGVLTRRLGWTYKTGFFIGFLLWLPVLIWVAFRLRDGWFACI